MSFFEFLSKINIQSNLEPVYIF